MWGVCPLVFQLVQQVLGELGHWQPEPKAPTPHSTHPRLELSIGRSNCGATSTPLSSQATRAAPSRARLVKRYSAMAASARPDVRHGLYKGPLSTALGEAEHVAAGHAGASTESSRAPAGQLPHDSRLQGCRAAK